MKSLGTLAFLALIAFYIAWPAYSGYEIKTALEAKDTARLTTKIDFASVRASLRPAVATKVEKVLVETLKQGGAASGPLTDQLRAQLMPAIIDGVLNILVTPEQLIRIHSQGLNLKDAMDAIVTERAGQAPGLAGLLVKKPDGGSSGSFGGLSNVAEQFGVDTSKIFGGSSAPKKEEPPPAVTTSGQGEAPAYGIENIKRFGLNGPLGIAIGIAKDPAASAADLTAEMSFIDGDWKLTGLVPRI